MNFLNEENMRLIWSVVQKSKHLNHLSYNENIELLKYFYSTISHFDKTKNVSTSELVDLNKRYLAYIVKTNTMKQNHTMQEDMFIPYTNEELQNIKREKFNDELTKKQLEFSQYTQKIVPPSPLSFLEENDKPSHTMEELISQTIAQRELDVATFQKYHPPPPPPLLQKQRQQEQAPPRLITIMNSSPSDETNIDVDFQPIILDDIQQEDIQQEKIKEKNTINRHISWEDEQLPQNKIDVLEEKINTIFQLLNKIDMKLEKMNI